MNTILAIAGTPAAINHEVPHRIQRTGAAIVNISVQEEEALLGSHLLERDTPRQRAMFPNLKEAARRFRQDLAGVRGRDVVQENWLHAVLSIVDLSDVVVIGADLETDLDLLRRLDATFIETDTDTDVHQVAVS